MDQRKRIEVDFSIETGLPRFALCIMRMANAVRPSGRPRANAVQKRILFAIHKCLHKLKATSGGRSFFPHFFPGRAVQDETTLRERAAHGRFVRVRNENDLVCIGMLDGNGNTTGNGIQLGKIKLEPAAFFLFGRQISGGQN